MENDTSSPLDANMSMTALRQSLYDEFCQAYKVIADCKPLAIGALHELVALGKPSRITAQVLFKHVQKSAYLRAIAAGGPRYHIDGSIAEDILQEHRDHAVERLAVSAQRVRDKKEAAAALKVKAAQQTPPAPASKAVLVAKGPEQRREIQDVSVIVKKRRTLIMPRQD